MSQGHREWGPRSAQNGARGSDCRLAGCASPQLRPARPLVRAPNPNDDEARTHSGRFSKCSASVKDHNAPADEALRPLHPRTHAGATTHIRPPSAGLGPESGESSVSVVFRGRYTKDSGRRCGLGTFRRRSWPPASGDPREVAAALAPGLRAPQGRPQTRALLALATRRRERAARTSNDPFRVPGYRPRGTDSRRQ